MESWLKRLFSHLEPDESHPLQVRLFQLICATVGVLCLLVILPINLFQNLPIWINLADVVLGLVACYCYWASTRGRHYFLGFFAALMGLLSPIWFFNAGSEGSIAYYYFPAILYPLAVLRGRLRWILAVLLGVDLCALLIVEYYVPGLVVPFQRPTDRLIDLVSGAACSLLALGVIIGLILQTYDREQARLSRLARELATSEQNYREIFNSTSDAMFIRDEEGRLVDVNDRMRTMFGYEGLPVGHLTISDLSLGTTPIPRWRAGKNSTRRCGTGRRPFSGGAAAGTASCSGPRWRCARA